MLGGESGVWRALLLYGDWVGIRGVALYGYIHSFPYTIPTPDTHRPTQPTPPPTPLTQPIYPTTTIHHSSNPHPSRSYANPIAKTPISPNKAHMSLWRFCCALTNEYKCKTSNINKRLLNRNEQRLNTNKNY